MTQIELNGLRADLPIAVMAAFGVLRICDRKKTRPRLFWVLRETGFRPVIQLDAAVNRDDLIALLISDLRDEKGRAALGYWEQIKKVRVEDFAARVGPVLGAAEPGERELADWFAAFASDLILDDGVIEATPFDMSAARQKFLADAGRLAESLAGPTKGRNSRTVDDCYGEALFGPWRYADDQHSLGWDPSTMKLGAFTPKAPTGMPNAGVRVAVWLAFESLPLFPVFAVDGKQQTRSFRQRKKATSFCWPVWREPLTLAALKSLLAWPGLTHEKERSEAGARGLTGIYEAQKYKPNKYLASFRPPELVWVGEG